jgi:hypothetical protein
MIKIIKSITIAFIMAMVGIVCLLATKNLLFRPIIDWLMKIRGTYQFEGDERGTETIAILLEIVFPLIYATSFAIVYKWLSMPPKQSK